MQEPADKTELKMGGTKEFKVGDHTLILEPIPYGRLKTVMTKLMAGVTALAGTKDMGDAEIAAKMPEVIMNQMEAILPLLFNPKKHPFLNNDWLQNNITLPLIMEIATDAIKVNGLMDFFAKLKAAQQPAPPLEIRPLVEKTPEKKPLTTP